MIRRLIERNSEALMTNILSADLGEGVRANYRLWNEEKRAELTALFEKLGPNGYSIEYVGSPVQDGAKAMDEMWDQYRSEERRVGKGCVSTFRYRWTPYH